MCLIKDPSKRPSAHKLLKQPFFKQARSQDYIVRKILDGLPTLVDRHQALKVGTYGITLLEVNYIKFHNTSFVIKYRRKKKIYLHKRKC